MLNLLTRQLPYSVYISSLSYDIDTDFRKYIKFQIMMEDNEMLDSEKIIVAMKLFYGEQPIYDYQEAIEQIYWMFSCGEIGNTDETIVSKDKTPVYSFEHDHEYIYAAFMQAYKIDLLRTDMHWWVFKSLFDSLPDDTRFRQIVNIRAMTVDDSMSKEQQKYYKKMKKVFALPDNRTQEEKEGDFIDALGL